MPELSVFSFDHYRDFLKAIFASRKQIQPDLTIGNFSKTMGFGSANYFGLVVSGKRKLTVEQIHRISRSLKFTFEETIYFEALVQKDQAQSEVAKSYYTRRAQEMLPSRPKSSSKFPAKLLLEEWYFPAVALLADGLDPASALQRLLKDLPFDQATIESWLERLGKMEILVQEQGAYRLNHRHQIFHDLRSISSRHKNFLRNQMKLSLRTLDREYEKGARFYAHTFTIKNGDLPFYEDRVRSLISDFTARSDQSKVDDVVQLNVQLFRITKGSFRT